MACKPRILEDSIDDQDDDDDYIDLDLFQKIKEAALLCPVCYDVYKNPLNVRQCLHKFCCHCIEDYNRKMKKECPACRQQIGSRRLLRQDVKTQNIITSLISDIDEFNRLEQEERDEAAKLFDYQGFNQKMQEVISAQEIIVQREKYEKIQEKQKKNVDRINRRQLRMQQREESDSEYGAEEDSHDEESSEEQQ